MYRSLSCLIVMLALAALSGCASFLGLNQHHGFGTFAVHKSVLAPTPKLTKEEAAKAFAAVAGLGDITAKH